MSNRRRSMLLSCLAAAASMGVGCAEVITYSNKAVEQGEALQAQGRTEEAAGAFRNAIQQNPSNFMAHFHLGECYQALNQEQLALQSFKTALEVMPAVDVGSKAPDAVEEVKTRDQLVNGLANCVAKSASRDTELAALQAKANASNRPLDWYVVARTNVALGDADAAIEAYDRAVAASDNKDWSIVRSYGLYLARLGQPQRAEETLRRAYQIVPAADEEVNAALRQLGVVPGPSLLEPSQLKRPPLPKGPLPEVEINVRDQRRTTPSAAQ